MRTPLTNGTIISSNFNYIIDSVAGEGASSIVYHAHYQSEGTHSVILKECYPYDIEPTRSEDGLLCWNDETVKNEKIDAFKDAYKRLLSFQNGNDSRNSTVASFHCFEANNTVYSATLLDNGVTFDKDNTANLTDILKTILALTKVVSNIHNSGYLHLDIKPENFIVIPETRELVRLFDFDTVTSLEDIRNGKIKAMSYSQGWSAPEQAQGNISKISFSADVYAIGAILFYKIFGRKPDNADRSQFATWDFDGEMFDGINPKVKRLLSILFSRTISANPQRRFAMDELISSLQEITKASQECQYLLNDYPCCSSNFVGRTDDIDSLFDFFLQGYRCVFVHGFGGIGKSELAKKYAETYSQHYDAIVFYFYNPNERIEKLCSHIKVHEDDSCSRPVKDYEELQTLCKTSNTLIIVDNFDFENDSDIDTGIDDLLKIDADIIITSRNDFSEYYSGDNVCQYELGTLPTDELVKLFKKEYAKNTTAEEDDIIAKIIRSFDNYTLLIPVIAKYLIASGTTISDYFNKIETDGLKSFDDGTTEIRIKYKGQFIKKDQMALLRYVFDMSRLSPKLLSSLQAMFLLKHNEHLTKNEYLQITKSKNINSLNDLIFLNWVHYDKELDQLSLHPMIQELIESDTVITPESVPGVYSYICEIFENLENCNSISDADELGYALLLYYDFCDSDQKSSEHLYRVYSFVQKFFFTDMNAMNKLLFDGSKYTSWRIVPSWLIPKLIVFVSEKRHTVCDNNDVWLSIQSIIDTCCWYVSYLYFICSDDVRLLFNNDLCPFISFVKNDSNQSEDSAETENNSDRVWAALNRYIISLYATLKKPSSICKNGYVHTDSNAVFPIPNDDTISYVYTKFMIDTIQNILTNYEEVTIDDCEDMSFEEELEENISLPTGVALLGLKEIRNLYEELLIDYLNSNGGFAFWGDPNIYDLTLPTVDEYQKMREQYNSLHWSYKAKQWYRYVDNSIKNNPNPALLYNLLLDQAFHETIPQSFVKQLVENHLISRILLDKRITADDKKTLLFNKPVYCTLVLRDDECNSSFRKIKNFKKSHKSTLSLYAQALSAIEQLTENGFGNVLTKSKLDLCEVSLIIRAATNGDILDVENIILSTSQDNWYAFIQRLLDITKLCWHCGLRKVSGKIKNCVIDACVNSLPELEEKYIQLIILKVLPLAKKAKRNDAVEIIERFIDSPRRELSIDLIDSNLIDNTDGYQIIKNVFKTYLYNIGLYYWRTSHNENPTYPNELENIVNGLFEKYTEENPCWCCRQDIIQDWYQKIKITPNMYYENVDVDLGIDDVLCSGFDMKVESCEGLFIQTLKIIPDENWDLLPEEYFYDLTESWLYPNGRTAIFRDTLLKLFPQHSETINRLL